MKEFSYLFAIVAILLILFVFWYHAKPKAEGMIAADSIMRLSRGYNGMNTGGSYVDAMHQLHEAEVMSLGSVETDPKNM